jgi:hypothetical protein
MMRKNNKVLHDAEEQLVFGQCVDAVSDATDNLRQVLPGCLLVELLEAKLSRMRKTHPPGISPWAA